MFFRSRNSQLLKSARFFTNVSITTPAVEMLNCPGLRVVNLNRPDKKNLLSKSVIDTIAEKLRLIELNPAVAVVMFKSHSPFVFSDGLLESDDCHSSNRISLLKAANKVTSAIAASQKETIAVFGGTLKDSAFGLFGSSKYRLGTHSTSFSIEILKPDRISLGGGLAHHLVNGSAEGLAIARYLAVSEKVINAEEMRSLGLLTHIVEDEPHLAFVHGLGHTLPSNDHLKAQQSSCVEVDSVLDLLNTMDTLLDAETASALEDMSEDPLWDEIMMIKPVPLKDSPKMEVLCDLQEWKHELQHCFAVENVAECKKRLAVLSKTIPWAQDALNRMDAASPAILNEWFVLTKLAVVEPLSAVMSAEENFYEKC